MAVKQMELSGDKAIDGLLSGYNQWSGDRLAYSIATSASTWSDYPATGSFPSQTEYHAPDAVQAASIRQAIATWASYMALPMVEVEDNAATHGDLRVAFSIDPARPTASLGTYPGVGSGGDIWLNGRGADGANAYAIGSGYYSALLHEVGHALGLKHPFDSGGAGSVPNTDPAHNNRLASTMAYEWVAGSQQYYVYRFPTTPMVDDIRAIQYLYGKNTGTMAGDTTYEFNDNEFHFKTLYDAGGTNTFRYTGDKAATLDLRAGHGSMVGEENWLYTGNWVKYERIPNVWIADGTLIQNASGGNGADTIIGNDAANRLSGGAGNDKLDGGKGDDVLEGGSGLDVAVYDGSHGAYAVKLVDGQAIVSDGSGSDALVGVERLQFADTMWVLDVDGHAGTIYRTYQAAFGRAPDLGGLGFWLAASDAGMSLETISQAFVDSAEFKALYGASPGNAQILDNFYANVLHRAPDQAGYDFWLKVLDGKLASAAQVLQAFSDSPENQAALVGVIGDGFAYTPYGA